MVRSTLDTVAEQSGLPAQRVRELCVDCDWSKPQYQKWLDTAEPRTIALWVRRTDDFVHDAEENW
jgi:hypothetical protein